MPNWKSKTLVVVIALMLMRGVCQAQRAQGLAAVPPEPLAGASASAPTRMRSGSPPPYSPPVAVPSVAGQIPPLLLPSPSISVTPVPPPSFSSTCDGNGCWGADGTRYNAIGGALLRPDGRTCQNLAGVLSCP